MFFQKIFRRKKLKKGIVGINFTRQGIALAVANFKSDRKLKLVYCSYFKIDTTENSPMLKQLIKELNLTEYHCHVVLDSEDYRSITIEKPSVAENEIREAIHWKINDLIDFPIDEATIDYFLLPAPTRVNQNQMMEVIASPDKTIRQLAQKCSLAKLNLDVIEIKETALRNLAMLLPENHRGVALLYLKESYSTLLIQKEGAIYLSRKIEIGTHQLNLANEANDEGLASTEQNTLALEIQRSLDYVESYFGIPPISSLVVIPLAQNTQELLNILNNNHGITARIMDLSTIIDSDILLDDPTQSLCAPVIGATLRYAAEAL